MTVPAYLTIVIDELSFDELLSDWRWLIKPGYAPVLMTAFGDLFLRDEAGHIHFLDLMSGNFSPVATSQEEFDRLCDERGQRRSWFIGLLVRQVRERCGELAAGECYGCKVPLSLGGEMDPDNFERISLQAHYSILGQLYRQAMHLPPDTKIDSVQLGPSDEDVKPKSWWQRLMGCK